VHVTPSSVTTRLFPYTTLFRSSKCAGFNNVEQVFFTTVFSLLGYVARKDGPVNNKEIVRANTFMENMHLDTAQRQQAEQLFLQGASPNFKVEKALQNFQGLAQR